LIGQTSDKRVAYQSQICIFLIFGMAQHPHEYNTTFKRKATRT